MYSQYEAIGEEGLLQKGSWAYSVICASPNAEIYIIGLDVLSSLCQIGSLDNEVLQSVRAASGQIVLKTNRVQQYVNQKEKQRVHHER